MSRRNSKVVSLAILRTWMILFVSLLCSRAGHAQLSQIDPAKLPQNERVQDAFSKALSVESMARNWNADWHFDTPKQQVASILISSLQDLQSAEAGSPKNSELFLLSGLVAHFAYNVDVEDAYKTAVESLQRAHGIAPNDYRSEWFLGMHHCQADEIEKGMEQMLSVESQVPWQQLPEDFWDDYTTCATLALMPAHNLRAADHAVALGASLTKYDSVVDMANKRYRLTDTETSYAAHDVWQGTKQTGEVQFRSQLCGLGFSAHRDWHVDVRDVAKGTCIVSMETGPYASREGHSTPTLLLLTQCAKPQETLDDFVSSFVNKYPSARQIQTTSCPTEKCVAF